MDEGVDSLSGPGGLAALIMAMEDHVMQFQDDEARDLCHVGTRADGPPSRQTGESMASFGMRRKKWIQRLTSLDNSTVVTGDILADYLLEPA